MSIRNIQINHASLSDESFLELTDELHAPAAIIEECKTPLDILDSNLLRLPLGHDKLACRDQIAGVSDACLLADFRE